MVYSWLSKPKFLLFLPLVLLLVVALACGEDDTPTPRPTATQVPATAVPQATSPPATSRPLPTTAPTPTPVGVAIEPPTPTAPPVQEGLEPIRGGIVTASMISDAAGWDPMQVQSLTSVWFSSIYYSNLVEYDPLKPGVLICGVCEEFTAAADGLSYTFKIRKGVKFHDGSEITAEDVKFSFDYGKLEGEPRPHTHILNTYLDRVEMDDPYTVTMYLKQVSAAFTRQLGMEWFKIHSKAHVESGVNVHVHANIMGSGPWLPVEYTQGVSVRTERNPNYFREGMPYFDAYNYFILSDPGTEMAAFRTEKILMTEHVQQGIDSLNKLAQDNRFLENYDIWFQPGINGVHFIVNTNKAPYDDPKVREAFNLALYRQPILATIGGGRFTIGKAMSPNNPFALPDEEILQRPGYRELNGEKHPDDIARARQLWAEAGFSADNPLVANITAPNAKPHPDLGQIYKQNFEDVLQHVDLTFINQDLGGWFSDNTEGRFDITASGKGADLFDPDERFASIYLTANRNFSDQELPGVRELFDAQSQELDIDKRREIALEMQRLVLDNAPATMEIAWETQGIFIHKRIMTKAGRYVLALGRGNAGQHYHEWLLPETPDRPAFGADPGFGGN